MMVSAPFSEEMERAAQMLVLRRLSSSNRSARTSLWTLRTAMYPDYRISLSRLLSTFHHTGV
jgi:hypothetical protein